LPVGAISEQIDSFALERTKRRIFPSGNQSASHATHYRLVIVNTIKQKSYSQHSTRCSKNVRPTRMIRVLMVEDRKLAIMNFDAINAVIPGAAKLFTACSQARNYHYHNNSRSKGSVIHRFQRLVELKRFQLHLPKNCPAVGPVRLCRPCSR